MPLPAPRSHPGATDEPLIAALVAERCPGCGARLSPAAQWCSLCFADLRPAPAPAPSASEPPVTRPDAVPLPSEVTPQAAAGSPAGASIAGATVASATQLSAPGAAARPTWPCSGCGASVDVELDACPACGIGFLGALRSSSTGIELPIVGDLRRFSDRSRVLLAAGIGLAIAFVLVLLTALLGH